MRLILVRHGSADGPYGGAGPPLSQIGRAEAASVGKMMLKADLKVDNVYHSVKLRAAETAGIICDLIGFNGEPEERNGLKPNDSVESIAGEISSAKGTIMLVGHLPFMDRLSSLLLTGDAEDTTLLFSAASAACFESDNQGGWYLLWFINPTLSI